MKDVDYYLCGLCATPTRDNGPCPACDANLPIRVHEGYLIEFPAGTLPCPGCASNAEPVKFRGWSRLMSFLWWSRETRMGGYVCPECARTEATRALWFTAAVGWWSVPAVLFLGWRSTYHNWRSVWAAPRRPYEWGAISAAEFTADLRAARKEAMADFREEWLRTETPLGALNEAQLGAVLEADGLYELLGVQCDAPVAEVQRAYRACCKAAHPDLNEGSRQATERMIALNQAWEVLRSPQMRAAYDWLAEQHDEAVAA